MTTRTNPKTALAWMALVLTVADASYAQQVDAPAGSAKPPSAIETAMDEIGLFRSGLDVSELNASGPILADPAISEPEPEDDKDDDA
jgi:hypothetical protein